MHYGTPAETQSAERAADAFGWEFLTPTNILTEYLPDNATVRQLLQVRSQFKVSAMVLAYAAHSSGCLTDCAYRKICIELPQKGFRTTKPGRMPNYEISRVFSQVLAGPRNSTIDAQLIVTDLAVPVGEIHALTFGARLRPAQTIEATRCTQAWTHTRTTCANARDQTSRTLRPTAIRTPRPLAVTATTSVCRLWTGRAEYVICIMAGFRAIQTPGANHSTTARADPDTSAS